MELNKNVPAIRFKGFDDQWNKSVLGDIGKTFTGLSGKTKEDFGFGEGRFVTYMNVFSNIISDFKKIDKVQVDKTQNSVQFGDVFFTTSSETPEEVGMSSVWLFDKKNVYLNSFCFGYRPTSALNHYYLAYYLRSVSFRKKMIPLAQGISRYNISKGKVMELDISIPCENEQTQIGNFFKTLDSQINAQEQKHQKLINLKKAMLEKMFPKEGADEPEIRFKGFTEKWEEKKLGEVVDDLYNGQTPYRLNESFWNGDINWLTSGELNRGTVIKVKEKITLAGKKNANLRLIPKGTFVIAITGLEAVGTRGNCGILDFNTTMNQSCMAIFPNRKYLDTKFLFQWYRKSSEEIGVRYTQGTKQQSFNYDIIKKLLIVIPTIEEQQKIGEYFDKLDKLIQQSQTKIEKHKNIKQALLQKMFV